MNCLLLKASSSVDASPILASPESRKGITWSPDVDVIESAGALVARIDQCVRHWTSPLRASGHATISPDLAAIDTVNGDPGNYIAQSTLYSVVLPSNCSSSLSASSRVWWTTPSR
jgi:hypothetical protein